MYVFAILTVFKLIYISRLCIYNERNEFVLVSLHNHIFYFVHIYSNISFCKQENYVHGIVVVNPCSDFSGK